MDRPNTPSCSSTDKEIQIARVNVEGQTQGNASPESWLSHVKSTFNPPRQLWQVSRKVCIYRVPKCIRINNPEVYDPYDISFGPYHHLKDPHLRRMDQYKLEALHRMVERLKIDVTSLIAEVQKLENEIRDCYAEPIEWDGETLCWMLTMDACFILEFCRSREQNKFVSDLNCFSLVFQNGEASNVLHSVISNDIIKVENQIPLCILITLLKLEFQTVEMAKTMLAELLGRIQQFWGDPFLKSPLLQGQLPNIKQKLEQEMRNNPPPCHLLDLYRIMVNKRLVSHSSQASATAVECPDTEGAENINSDRERCGWWRKMGLPGWMKQLSCMCIIRSSTFINQAYEDSRSTPCVQLLQGAGIKFQPGKLRFENKWLRSSTLYLPSIAVYDHTENLLRNLMAYEECQRCSWSPQQAIISQYAYLFDDLIDSEKDVSILKKSQIIVSIATSDNEIAHMFNRLQHGIRFTRNKEIEAVMGKVREHYRSQWKVWLCQFKEEYFSKPWYVISLVAAILVLGMTAVQTLFSVKK